MRRFIFFFSSRRRHTRLQGDWSSDVCSSDLLTAATLRAVPGADDGARPRGPAGVRQRGNARQRAGAWSARERSEEGRVGKEGRSRGAPDHLKKKKKRTRGGRRTRTAGETHTT